MNTYRYNEINMLNINSFTKIRFLSLLVAIISTLSLTSLVGAQEEDIEIEPPTIVSDSCVLNLENGTQVPFLELEINSENPPVSVACQVTNDTDHEVFLDPSITLNTALGEGEGIMLETEDNYILFPNTTSPVLFTFPENTEDTTYDIEVTLTGEFETTTLSTENSGKEEEDIPSPRVEATQEPGFVLYAVVSLLALLVLLAILVYRRKSESLSETLHPIEGDSNLEK